MTADRMRIEEAALNAWPALQQILYDGWILRFSKGFTKRSNSVNPIYRSRLDLRSKIEACEALYNAHDLATIFRITPFSQPATLDSELERLGYARVEESLVQIVDLARIEDGSVNASLPGGFTTIDGTAGWLEEYGRLAEARPEEQALHLQLLNRVAATLCPALWVDSGRPISCGLGVLEGDAFGLIDLQTEREHRRQGHATRLVRAMLVWARRNGARCAYLQVTARNAAAHGVYRRLGFIEFYPYWYRIKVQG